MVVVHMLTFYSNDLSSKPTLVYSFNSAKLFEKNENKRKRRRLELIFEKYSVCVNISCWPLN